MPSFLHTPQLTLVLNPSEKWAYWDLFPTCWQLLFFYFYILRIFPPNHLFLHRSPQMSLCGQLLQSIITSWINFFETLIVMLGLLTRAAIYDDLCTYIVKYSSGLAGCTTLCTTPILSGWGHFLQNFCMYINVHYYMCIPSIFGEERPITRRDIYILVGESICT